MELSNEAAIRKQATGQFENKRKYCERPPYLRLPKSRAWVFYIQLMTGQHGPADGASSVVAVIAIILRPRKRNAKAVDVRLHLAQGVTWVAISTCATCLGPGHLRGRVHNGDGGAWHLPTTPPPPLPHTTHGPFWSVHLGIKSYLPSSEDGTTSDQQCICDCNLETQDIIVSVPIHSDLIQPFKEEAVATGPSNRKSNRPVEEKRRWQPVHRIERAIGPSKRRGGGNRLVEEKRRRQPACRREEAAATACRREEQPARRREEATTGPSKRRGDNRPVDEKSKRPVDEKSKRPVDEKSKRPVDEKSNRPVEEKRRRQPAHERNFLFTLPNHASQRENSQHTTVTQPRYRRMGGSCTLKGAPYAPLSSISGTPGEATSQTRGGLASTFFTVSHPVSARDPRPVTWSRVPFDLQQLKMSLQRLLASLPPVRVAVNTAPRHRSQFTAKFAFLPPITYLFDQDAYMNQVQFPAGSPPDVRMWSSCRTMPLVGGFSRGSPVYPALSFRRNSILTSITLIGSQVLAVTCHHSLFTHSAGTPRKGCTTVSFVCDFTGNVLCLISYAMSLSPTAFRGCYSPYYLRRTMGVLHQSSSSPITNHVPEFVHMFPKHAVYSIYGGISVAWSPPTKAIRLQSPAGSLRIFACANPAGRCRWSAGFLEDLPFPPPFIPALLNTHPTHPHRLS
ncbi:hypothetical protein PR048_027897 [Dryococelus australis]|uniref:Uncharacterized protein n=1 Tax=Dryococelus australis TaxID=614101 RepID=A0ABQ9GHT7_9NEOP|nr:hypothetical protein PR048_027897 [Dryococelus australis]